MSIPTPASTPTPRQNPDRTDRVPPGIATGACPPRPCSRSAVAPSPPTARRRGRPGKPPVTGPLRNGEE